MLNLDFLASFSLIIFLTDFFLILPDLDVDEDKVNVSEAAPLFNDDEYVPDVLLPSSSGSCPSRKLFLCSGRLKMLPVSTPMFSGCPVVFVVDVDVDCGDHVALTAGFCTATVSALPSTTEVEHDGGDAVDGFRSDVSVPRVAEHREPEPCVSEHGVVAVTLLPVPMLASLFSVDISPCDGVPKHPVDTAGECEVGVVSLLPVPLLAILLYVLLISRTLVRHLADASSSAPPSLPALNLATWSPSSLLGLVMMMTNPFQM